MFPQTPFFRLVAALAVALGIATVGAFHGLERVVLRPLPYPDAGKLIVCFRKVPFSPPRTGAYTFNFADWRSLNHTLQPMAGFHWQKFLMVSGGGEAETVLGSRVSQDFFTVLGAQAALGRAFSAERDLPDQGRKVVLSDSFWRRRLGAGRGAIGSALSLNGDDYAIVGVMPPEFWFLSRDVQFWVLLPFRPNYLVSTVARLRPGVTLPQAQAEVRDVEKRLAGWPWLQMRLRSLQEQIYWNGRAALYLLIGAIGFVTTIGFVYAYRLLRSDESIPHRLAVAARACAFLVLKTVPGLLVLAAVWIGMVGDAGRAGEGEASWSFGGLVILGWILMLLGCGVIRWSLLDQDSRCPVCLHRLRMPVATGSWSSLMVDSPGTEYICPFGHGRLYVPGTRLLNAAPMRWTFYRDFLQRLFYEKSDEATKSDVRPET